MVLSDNVVETAVVDCVMAGKAIPVRRAVCGDCAIACVGCSAVIGISARRVGSRCYVCFTEEAGMRCCIKCHKPTRGKYLNCWNCKD
jgi:hypothetical protein